MAQAVHEVVAEDYRNPDSVNYELATYTPANWVCLFETRFSFSVEHLRQRFPQGTGSLLSLLARVPSRVLASLALCLASDFVRDRPLSLECTPSRIGSSAWFLSCVVWVSFFACPLALPALFVSGLFSGRMKLGASFFLQSFSHLSSDLSTDLISHRVLLEKSCWWCGSWWHFAKCSDEPFCQHVVGSFSSETVEARLSTVRRLSSVRGRVFG